MFFFFLLRTLSCSRGLKRGPQSGSLVISLYRNILFFSLIKIFSTLQAAPLSWEGSAPIALLINAETGAVLYEKNSEKIVCPGSTTKIATALFVLEKGLPLDQIFTANWRTIGTVAEKVRMNNASLPPYQLEIGGTHMNLVAGEKLSLWTLLQGLMTVSGNDAANVIAEGVSGSIEGFMQDMNLFLKEKGCSNTYLINPHGLPHKDHVSTARDLALLFQKGLKHPLFLELIQIREFLRPETNKQHAMKLTPTFALIRAGKYFYPKAIGGKTGHVKEIGFNAVGAAEEEGRRLIAVVLGCKSSEIRWKEMVSLFELGFREEKATRVLFSAQEETFRKEFDHLKTAVMARLGEDVFVEYYPSEEPEWDISVEWIERSEGGVERGELVGFLVVGDRRDFLGDGRGKRAVQDGLKDPLKVPLKTPLKVPLYAIKEVRPKWTHELIFLKQKLSQKPWFKPITLTALLGLIASLLFPLMTRSKQIHP